MDVRQLELLRAIVEHGSMSKASEALYCSQPMLSTQMSKLEQELGYVLFDRSKRPLTLTHAGEMVYQYALDVQNLEQLMRRNLEFQQERLLRIGASSVPGTHMVPSILQRFLAVNPEVRFSLIQGDSSEILSQLQHGLLDMGMVGSKIENVKLSFTPLVDDELVLALPATKQIDKRYTRLLQTEHQDECMSQKRFVELLKDVPFLLREEGSGTRRAMEQVLKAYGLTLHDLRIVSHVNDQETLCACIAQGLGVSIISRMVVQDFVNAEKMHAVPLYAQEVRKFYVVTKADQELSKDQETFIRIAQEIWNKR